MAEPAQKKQRVRGHSLTAAEKAKRQAAAEAKRKAAIA